MIGSRINPKKEIKKTEEILSKSAEWGPENCQALLDGQAKIGMTPDMILQAFGPPSGIDQKTKAEKYYQERWIFGIPGRGAGANYLTIRDGKIVKVEQNVDFKIEAGLFPTLWVSLGAVFLVILFILFTI
jgi:hypothetical protein